MAMHVVHATVDQRNQPFGVFVVWVMNREICISVFWFEKGLRNPKRWVYACFVVIYARSQRGNINGCRKLMSLILLALCRVTSHREQSPERWRNASRDEESDYDQ